MPNCYQSTDKYFGVRGDKIIFYFHRDKLREFVKMKYCPLLTYGTTSSVGSRN